MDPKLDPSNPSGAYAKMRDAWLTIDDILAGPTVIRAKGKRYLPKNPAESEAEYKRRRLSAPWSPEFEDILRGLTAKPFAKEIGLRDGASQRILDLAEDIDGKGNNLTAFSQPPFRSGVARGMSAILVDNTGDGSARTVAQEKAAGVRPYWLALKATDILDLKTAFVGGRELPYHVRIEECRSDRDGYAEIEVERVREFNREPTRDGRGEITALGAPTWKVWEKQQSTQNGQDWRVVNEGVFAPLAEIPLALFWTGERDGSQFVRPPLYAIADKQLELYRAGSRYEETLTASGFFMLAANGIGPPPKGETIETGPNRILYAGAPQASWKILAPEATTLTALQEDLKRRTDDIRRLGMQPLTQRTGTATATEIAIEGARAHSALETWANAFKDCLEQAFVYTSQWLGEDANVELDWTIDFLAGLADQPSLDALTKSRYPGVGAAPDLSHEDYITGLKRFGVLPADFDGEANQERLATEQQGLEPEPALNDPALTTDPTIPPPAPVPATL